MFTTYCKGLEPVFEKLFLAKLQANNTFKYLNYKQAYYYNKHSG